MPRIIFENNSQSEFLRNVKLKNDLSTNYLAVLCQVSPRTIRDWLRGKLTISEKAFRILVTKFSLEIPNNIKIVGDYWYTTKGGKKGALKRFELYGSLGTPEGRRKGGIISQSRRREDPEKYKLLGCNIKKEFKIEKPSLDLAEVTGIILGDGAITNDQLTVSLSSIVDRSYSKFVRCLIRSVFNEHPKIRERLSHHVIVHTLSGAGLVEELERFGFKRGNKVKQQVDFPVWIWQNVEFQKACVRGLMDTDGGCYFHKHKSNGLVYRNFGMCFTNKSLPIVQSVAKVLKSLGLKFSLTNSGTQIYIYSFEEIKKYFNLIGSHNQKNIDKFEFYLNQKSHRVIFNKVGCESGLISDLGKVV